MDEWRAGRCSWVWHRSCWTTWTSPTSSSDGTSSSEPPRWFRYRRLPVVAPWPAWTASGSGRVRALKAWVTLRQPFPWDQALPCLPHSHTIRPPCTSAEHSTIFATCNVAIKQNVKLFIGCSLFVSVSRLDLTLTACVASLQYCIKIRGSKTSSTYLSGDDGSRHDAVLGALKCPVSSPAGASWGSFLHISS